MKQTSAGSCCHTAYTVAGQDLLYNIIILTTATITVVMAIYHNGLYESLGPTTVAKGSTFKSCTILLMLIPCLQAIAQ